jgi:hypothetical protein
MFHVVLLLCKESEYLSYSNSAPDLTTQNISILKRVRGLALRKCSDPLWNPHKWLAGALSPGIKLPGNLTSKFRMFGAM